MRRRLRWFTRLMLLRMKHGISCGLLQLLLLLLLRLRRKGRNCCRGVGTRRRRRHCHATSVLWRRRCRRRAGTPDRIVRHVATGTALHAAAAAMQCRVTARKGIGCTAATAHGIGCRLRQRRRRQVAAVDHSRGIATARRRGQIAIVGADVAVLFLQRLVGAAAVKAVGGVLGLVDGRRRLAAQGVSSTAAAASRRSRSGRWTGRAVVVAVGCSSATRRINVAAGSSGLLFACSRRWRWLRVVLR